MSAVSIQNITRPATTWIFAIDLPRPSIRSSGVSQQYRMVRAHDFPFWRRGVCSTPADRSLFNVGRHTLRRPLLYGSGSDRTALRYHSFAFAGDVASFRATARPWLVALLHLAAFQTHSRFRYCTTRETSRRYEVSQQLAPAGLLE